MKVCHFHNGTGGGVLSVIKNLLLYKQGDNIENHVIYTINKDQVEKFEILHLTGAASEQVFYYSPKWNYYYTCKKLAALLPDHKSVIIAHDWMELGMVSNLGLQNPVVQILHGDFDYYYELSQMHANNIDAFICVSHNVETKLKIYLPHFKQYIFYIKFPVPETQLYWIKPSTFTAIYFVRDLTEERKQFKKIPLIQKALLEKNISINWIIAGGGIVKEDFKKIWGDKDLKAVNFCGLLSNDEIVNLLPKVSVMILPSLSEGFPISLVEAMKCGVVPLITDWGGATAELVIDNETGFLFNVDAIKEYAVKIELLINEPETLNRISKQARQFSNDLFNPKQNTFLYENVFLIAATSTKAKVKIKSYGSRLDQEWLGNTLTILVRNLLKKLICFKHLQIFLKAIK